MAVFEKQRSKQPRVDPRKIKGDGLGGRLQQMLASPRSMMRLGILLLLFVGTLAILHAPYEPPAHPKGSTVRKNILARVPFTFIDEAATETKRTEARRNTPNVYERLPKQSGQLLAHFNGLLEQAVEAITPPPEPPAETPPPEDTTPGEPQAEPTTPDAAGDATAADTPEKKAEETRTDYAGLWGLSGHFDEFKTLVADADALKAAQNAFRSLLAYHDSLAILSPDRSTLEEIAGLASICIAITDGTTTRHEFIDRKDLLDLDSNSSLRLYRAKLAARYERLFAKVSLSAPVGEIILDHFVDTLEANLRFSNELTERRKEDQARNVKPVEDRFTKDGEPLVTAGTEIADKEAALLKAEHEAYLKTISVWARIGSVLGSAILVALVLVIAVVYTMRYQPKVIERVVRAFILVVLFLLVAVVAKFFSTQLQRSMLIFPLTTAAMVITVAYNRRFALVMTWLMVLLVTLVARFDDYSGTLLLLLGTAVAILQLGEIRSRSKPITVGLVTGVVYFVTVWALELFWMTRTPVWTETLQRSGIAFVAGFLPGFIILGGLPFIEHIFNVVTSIRLLELCDANQPALKKLAIDAPGTYSHSLLLGSIVEPAAEAIGANGLLARVGSYFHDIGKANKPQYFIENARQVAANGDHTRLKPQMSKIIITSHIKDGLDMARQYGLPRAINAFIAEHHGTTVIEYFYNEARKSAEETVDDAEFRYPGPKPQSRETAILMLADGCEGAVRSLKDHSAGKIEDKVHEIVMKRLLDGQLEASGMTLNDVRAVELSVCKSLISVHHGRITYPDADGNTETKADAAAPPSAPRPGPTTEPIAEGQPQSDA